MKNEETMDPVSARACLYIEKLFRDFADGHDASHSIRVWRNAVRIASSSGGISPEKRRRESSTELITDSAESVGAASSAAWSIFRV